MLDPKTLDAIKSASQAKPKPQIIHIEIANGFAYGAVTIGSAGNKQAIQELATELGWTFREGGTQDAGMMYRTGAEFKDGKTAISIGETIRTDLESKGFQADSKVKGYR
jgi:hypothetical protein